MVRITSRWWSLLAAAAAAAVLAAAPAAADARITPTPGSPGLGDRVFPLLGNGGYDVQHYLLDLRYASADPTAAVHGTVTITARATQDLSRFDLDWSGGAIGNVTVDGRAARWSRDGGELVVTPPYALADGHKFSVQVADFVATPTVPDESFESTGLFFGTGGVATAPQPNAAHVFYPSNDHPRDKATFAFRIDVPAGTTAVANGVRTGRRTSRGRTVWRYLMRRPMATELTQVAVGAFDVTDRGAIAGVRFRDVTPRSLTSSLLPKLGLEREHFNWLRSRVGNYPFDTYGSFVFDAPFGFALETQTLSIFPATTYTDRPRSIWEPVMLHELSHQWFGDAVAPYDWSDLWLNEGHATWYDMFFAEERGFLPDYYGADSVEELMHRTYAVGDKWRSDYGPVAAPRADTFFSSNVYEGGALVLYALRQRIGTAAFERLEREWVGRNLNKSASTDDFIALASEVSGQDVGAFLRAWLYGSTTPPMPGHPDWAQGDVVGTADALSATAAAPLLRR